MVILFALGSPAESSYGRASHLYPLDAQTRSGSHSVLHRRPFRCARNAQLGLASRGLLRRDDFFLRKQGGGKSTELHRLWYLVVGAIANVDLLHHGSVGRKALGLTQCAQWRVSSRPDGGLRAHATEAAIGAHGRGGCRRHGRMCAVVDGRRRVGLTVGRLLADSECRLYC